MKHLLGTGVSRLSTEHYTAFYIFCNASWAALCSCFLFACARSRFVPSPASECMLQSLNKKSTKVNFDAQMARKQIYKDIPIYRDAGGFFRKSLFHTMGGLAYIRDKATSGAL